MPITYEFIDNGKSFNINYDDVEYTAGKNDVELIIPDVNDNDILEIRSYSAKFSNVTVKVGFDIITGVGAGSTTAIELRDALEAIFFLDESMPSDAVWGSISGDINNQTDLQNTFLNKVTTDPQTVAGPVEFEQDITVPTGSVILGKDGARVSSLTRSQGFTDARGNSNAVVHYVFDDLEGSEKPFYYERGSEQTLLVTDGLGTTLTGNQEFVFTTQADAKTNAFEIIPKSSGILRVESWEGTDDTGAKIADNSYDIPNFSIFNSVNTFRVELPASIITNSGDEQFTRFSGIDLEGGISSIPPFAGQEKIYLVSDLQFINKVELSVDRYYDWSRAEIDRPNQTTIALANQQNNIYETYHEYNYTPTVTDNYTISANGLWSLNATNSFMHIKMSITGNNVSSEFETIIEPKDASGLGQLANVLQGGNIVGNVITGTSTRMDYYFQEVVTLEASEIYSIKIEWKATGNNRRATIYKNLFQVEQKTIK